jgi:hypothetical protein
MRRLYFQKRKNPASAGFFYLQKSLISKCGDLRLAEARYRFDFPGIGDLLHAEARYRFNYFHLYYETIKKGY